MKLRNNFKAIQHKNYVLVVFALFTFLCGLALVVVAVAFLETFKWWGLGIAASGITSMYFATKAIRTNDPSWILLDLILPG